MNRIAERCIASVNYFQILDGINSRFIRNTRNTYGSDAVIFWCHLFGSRSEDLHIRNFFNRSDVIALSEDYCADNVIERIQRAINQNASQYGSFHQEVLDARNHHFSHTDLSNLDPIFPDIFVCGKMMKELRVVLREIVDKILENDPHNLELQGISFHISFLDGERIAAQCASDYVAGIRGANAQYERNGYILLGCTVDGPVRAY